MNFQKLTQLLDSVEQKGTPGCECIVMLEHEEVYHHCAGYADAMRTRKTDGSETYWLYSATKISTCTAAMQLVERGLIRLYDPVGKYLPAYNSMMVRDGDVIRPAKNTMTIRHLMSMQSGLNYNTASSSVRKAKEFYGPQGTTRQFVDAIAQEPLDFEPGTHYQYSLSHDVLGAVIEVASGLTLGEFLLKNIYEPLGMRCTSMHPDGDMLAHVCAQYRYDPDRGFAVALDAPNNGYRLSERYESGGAGLMSRASDYVLLADALANGGMGKTGERILKPETVDLYRTPQLEGQSLIDYKEKMLTGKRGYSYGLGVRTMAEEGWGISLGEFGWDGAAGAFLMADPEKRLALMYVEHVLGHGPGYSEIHPALQKAAYEALEA